MNTRAIPEHQKAVGVKTLSALHFINHLFYSNSKYRPDATTRDWFQSTALCRARTSGRALDGDHEALL